VDKRYFAGGRPESADQELLWLTAQGEKALILMHFLTLSTRVI